ncbi:MAG: arylesterase [Burkholderiales bacterium]|nr:arylesterase [Burkholderiales bacterium]
MPSFIPSSIRFCRPYGVLPSVLLPVLLALALLIPAAGHAQTATGPVLMVFGDSLSAEYGLPQGSGWVALMESRLKAENPGWRVVNASISGETTLGGRNRIDAELARHRPQAVVIALGGNDGLRGVSLETTRANLEYMVAASRKVNARPLLVGVRLPPNYGRTFSEKFRLVFVEAARNTKAPLVPFILERFAEKRDFFQPDGIHPTVAAQPLMLETLWPEISNVLKAR